MVILKSRKHMIWEQVLHMLNRKALLGILLLLMLLLISGCWKKKDVKTSSDNVKMPIHLIRENIRLYFFIYIVAWYGKAWYMYLTNTRWSYRDGSKVRCALFLRLNYRFDSYMRRSVKSVRLLAEMQIIDKNSYL